jgi:hypothetical protein
MENKRLGLGILIMVLVFRMTVVGWGDVADNGTNVDPSALFGVWEWQDDASANNVSVVITSFKITRTWDQPGEKDYNGYYSIIISFWEDAINQGENKDEFPYGFKVSGTITGKNGSVGNINDGDSITQTYYLNWDKNRMVMDTSARAGVVTKIIGK